ncbi:MAG: hypothetical protein IJ409_01185 [Lachnospiraceae bacterium]|nr:hypothetical protein [Lachnospiraceae bacterium]
MQILLRKVMVFSALLLMAAGAGGCLAMEEDKMLGYMEKKYKEHFAMVGSYGGQIGKDYTMVRVKSRNRPNDQALVRITYEKSGNVYQDNYLGFLLKEDIEGIMQPVAEEVFGECKVFYKVPHLVFPTSFGPDMSAEAFLKHPDSMVQLFIYPKEGAAQGKEMLIKYAERLKKEGYCVKGILSYPEDEETYHALHNRQFYRDGFAGYRASEEAAFAMKWGGGFRYVKWKGEEEQ